jgi:uncharacterized protein with von Willebrand factor type A (vWA) domain
MKGIFRYGNYGWLGEYRARSIISAVEKQAPEMKIDDPLIPLDLFHSCYLLNTAHEEKPQYLHKLCEPIVNDKELRKITIADDLISRVFAVKFLLALQEQLQRQREERRKQGQQELQQLLQQLSAGEGASEEQKKSAQEAKKLVEQAKEEAKKETEQIKLYAGLKAGVGHRVTFGELLDLGQFTVDLLELLKLFRDISAIDFTRSPKVAPFGSYEGIRFGRDLAKITPSALALPEELFWYRFATSTLPMVETKATELEEFLLLVDKSGSMRERNKTLWSRAVALALAMHAKKNRLKCQLAFFDDTVCQKKPIDVLTEFDKVLKHILSLKCEGGTSIDRALKFAEEQGLKKVIIITDGEDEVKVRPKKSLISVMVEGDNSTLKKVSEKYLKVRPDRSGALRLFEAISP